MPGVREVPNLKPDGRSLSISTAIVSGCSGSNDGEVARTIFAWLRTGAGALLLGEAAQLGLKRHWPEKLLLGATSILIVFAIFCFGVATWRLTSRDPGPGLRSLASHTLLMATNALLTQVGLITLLMIWRIKF